MKVHARAVRSEGKVYMRRHLGSIEGVESTSDVKPGLALKITESDSGESADSLVVAINQIIDGRSVTNPLRSARTSGSAVNTTGSFICRGSSVFADNHGVDILVVRCASEKDAIDRVKQLTALFQP